MKLENPFLTRIISEEQFCQNELFSIVKDIDPIVPGHYMIYSKEWRPSLADCDYRNAAQFIENVFEKKVKMPYAYFERGRASFCTSIQGVKHGHGHLVPCFYGQMEDIFPYGAVECFESFVEAYQAAGDGQYLIWGNIGETFYLINHVEEIPKRAIRNTIRANYQKAQMGCVEKKNRPL